MNIKALDSLLSQVVEAVIPRLIKKQMKPGDGVTKDEFEQIFYRLLLSTDIDTANKLIKQFNQYLISVGAVKYDENPGISIVRIKRPAARITVDGVHDLRWLSSLETLFLSSLDVLSSELEKRAGQLIFSAIRYGGLLRSAQIKLFMSLICKPPHYLDGHIWFEIEENNNEGTQIWNPDPLTLALLYNWYEDLMHIKLKDALKEKRTVFQWIHIINRFFNQDKKKTKKISPKKLIKAISSRLSLSMPAVLVDCAQGVHDSRTIHPEVYYRLITAKSPVHNIDCIEPPQQQSTRQKTIQKINTAHKSGLKDNELLLKTGQLLRSVNKRGQIAKEIKDLIDTLSSECNPITVYLCQWISIRLTHNNRWGNRYKAKSAYTRLRSIARRLGGWMGSEDPTKMGVQKLIEIYEEVIDSVDTISLRASIAKNLREFQEFLEDEWGAERITSDAPWAGYNKGGSNVDAKIILPEEYATATNFYFKQIEKEHNSLEKNLLIARLLLLIMGYRTGMRRKEGIGLRIKDICSMGRPEILIRPHEKRLLKSLSANRRIPVFIFFSTNEQELLLSFLKKREEEGAKPDDYFFCIRELQTPFINESLVFDHIQWLLQVVTGDPKTRYHHLRHSFATWRFWKWMMPRYYEYETLYRGFEQYDEQKLLNERKNVLGLQNGDEASHKVAYALSMSVGHSGPSMTLNHYIHSDHWMREIEFRRLSPQLSTKTISSLAGVSVRAVQKKAKGKKDSLTADLMRDRFIRKLKSVADIVDVSGWKNSSDITIPAYKRETGNIRLTEIDLWEAVQLYTYQKIPVTELEQRYCIDITRIQKVIDRAKIISQMKHPGPGHNTYRHRLPEWQKLTDPPIVFKYPHQERHLEQVELSIKKYNELAEPRKKLVKWGLGYFLANSSIGRSEIQFRRKKDIRRFLRVISVPGFFATKERTPRYQMVHYSSEPVKSKEREAQWDFWKKGFNLEKHQEKLIYKESAKQKNGYIALKILSYEPKSGQQKHKQKKGKRQADWGFKLSLYVLATVFGWEEVQ